MEPTSCGIGGDLFAIVGTPPSKLHGLNASGRSPQALTLEQTLSRDITIPRRGPLSVSVPGAVDGWFELQARFGRLPLPCFSRRRSITRARFSRDRSHRSALESRRADAQGTPGSRQSSCRVDALPPDAASFRNA